jgi:hypothetical protein
MVVKLVPWCRRPPCPWATAYARSAGRLTPKFPMLGALTSVPSGTHLPASKADSAREKKSQTGLTDERLGRFIL